MTERDQPPRVPADMPKEDQQIVKVPQELLEASRTPEAQKLLEYGAEYEKQLEEEGLIHP